MDGGGGGAGGVRWVWEGKASGAQATGVLSVGVFCINLQQRNPSPWVEENGGGRHEAQFTVYYMLYCRLEISR